MLKIELKKTMSMISLIISGLRADGEDCDEGNSANDGENVANEEGGDVNVKGMLVVKKETLLLLMY